MDDYILSEFLTGKVGKRALQRAKSRGDEGTEGFIRSHIDLDSKPTIGDSTQQEEQIVINEPTFGGTGWTEFIREDQTYSMSLENYFVSISPTRAQVSIGGKPILIYDQERETPNNETYWQDTDLHRGQKDTARSLLILGVSDLISETLDPTIETRVEDIVKGYENSSEEERIDFHINWDLPLPFDTERVDGKSLQEIAESYGLREIVEEKVHSEYQNEQGFWKLHKAMDAEFYDFMPLIHGLRLKLDLIPKDKNLVVRFATMYYNRHSPIAEEQNSN